MACVKTDNFKSLDQECHENQTATKTLDQIKSIATNQAVRYPYDDRIEAYVVSSDQAGNFFKKLSLQNRDGTLGFSINLDQTDLYTRYNPGRKIYIDLNNRYLQLKNDALEIGDLFSDSFNRETVGRIPYPKFESVITKACDEIEEQVLIKSPAINSLTDRHIHTLLDVNDIQFNEEALASTFYDENLDDGGAATNHILEDQNGNQLILRTSAFADFASLSIPKGSGRIRGVLTKFKDDYQLIARTVDDIQLTQTRFQIELKNNLFFTELADPNNNSAARFIEIYNEETTPVNLNGWSIRRYTNDNTDISSELDLSGSIIDSHKTFVIAANASEFERVYGFKPDLEAGTNGPADSNGDDNLELVDSQGMVVDVFGIIGQDGSGTNHEFEDGRAFRKFDILSANPSYVFNEWIIWNDTGLSGTIKEPQNAPEDFSPGKR